MSEIMKDCAFCDTEQLGWRTIRAGELFVSFVSNPRFREGQCLVIPGRHITSPVEMTGEEAKDVMLEAARLADELDQGFGSGIMQKFQPTQAENGIKMNHLHFHVFPRLEHEVGLFPVPEPNTFDGFHAAEREDIITMAESLR